jgi:hypothetical protein
VTLRERAEKFCSEQLWMDPQSDLVAMEKIFIELYTEGEKAGYRRGIEEAAKWYDEGCPACGGRNTKETPCNGMDHVVAFQIRALLAKGEER